jgi:glutathionyl-hydroquinone reductase
MTSRSEVGAGGDSDRPLVGAAQDNGRTMKVMIDGVWRGDIMPPPELATKHMIHGGSFRHKITNDGSSAFPAESGRYHLFVSYACPFAHRPLVVRALKWLDGIVPVSTLHPIWNMPDGWASGDTPLSTPDGGGNGFRFLHEAYRAANPTYTGKIIVPVLMGRTLATDRQQRVDRDREDVERRVRNGRRRPNGRSLPLGAPISAKFSASAW